MLMKLSRVFAVRAALADANGTFVTVTFTKEDGTVRRLNGRTGVVRYVKGTGAGVKSFYAVTLYDVKAKGYRTVRLDRVSKIAFANRVQVI